jgi:hypothetical protein
MTLIRTDVNMCGGVLLLALVTDPLDVKRTKKDSPLKKIAFVADDGGLTFEVSCFM